MIYFIVFCLSVFFAFMAEINLRRTALLRFYSFCALLLPVILAGLRHHTIGMDVDGYVTPYYEIASHAHSLTRYLKAIADSGAEVGYDVLVYICTKIFGSYNSILLVCQLMTLYPIYMGLLYYNKKYGVPLHFSYFIYLFFFYNCSLCVIRQGVAIGLIFYATTFLIERKYLMYILLSVLAVLFHQTSIFPISIILILGFINKYVDFTKTRNIVSTILVLAVFTYSLFTILDYFYINFSFIDDKYMYRLDREGRSGGGLVTAFYIILSLVPFLFKKNQKIPAFLTLLTVMGAFMYTLASVSQYISRLVLYLLVFIIITLSPLAHQKIIKYSLMLIIIAFWYRLYIVYNSWDTYPYLFYWQ